MRKKMIDPSFPKRQKIVGVMGSGEEEYETLSETVGRVIAQEGHHLLSGAGDGIMKAVSRAFLQVESRKGKTIGIVRAKEEGHLGVEKQVREYLPLKPPNEFVEIPIFTHLPYSGTQGKDNLSRNHINVLTSDVTVVLPGGSGTQSELELAVEYGWPIILFLGDQKVSKFTAAELVKKYPNRITLARNESELVQALRSYLQ
jgi:uncharacterized protein (TIGR00725 family)